MALACLALEQTLTGADLCWIVLLRTLPSLWALVGIKELNYGLRKEADYS